ncbi:MAG: hypothetical protein GQ558_03755 [Thermoplasmata archaeon]|nr:hypothetical protein [Thermoplasmata archaeon]
MEDLERIEGKYDSIMRWVTLLVGLNLLQMVLWPFMTLLAGAGGFAGEPELVDPDLCWGFLIVLPIMEGLFFFWLYRSRDWVVALIACVLAWALPLALMYFEGMEYLPFRIMYSVLPLALTLLIINMLWLRHRIKAVGGDVE